MANFFAELKRRQMFRAAAAYAVVAWVLLQLINNLTPALRLPEWAAALVVVLIVVGFPIALLFCWIQHLPADGAVRQKTNRVDWILVSGLAAVVLLIAYQQLAPNVVTTAQQSGVDASKAAANSPAGAISIAVLPLANLSGDTAQEFFSDGMTDEITSALAKVRDLRVVGRSSAFQFKGQNRDLRAIGQALSARYLIDGSVRKAGDRVRITAQLIEVNSGLNVWTENYDRQLTDIFAIQEDIAQAIAGALHVPLGLQQGERLVSNRTNDLDSYQQYLRARVLFRNRNIQQAIDLLESVVARDANYAPAWALLADSYGFVPAYNQRILFSESAENGRRFSQTALDKADMAAHEAMRIDPKHANGFAAFAYIQAMRMNWLQAEDLFRQALALDPNDTETLDLYSQMLLSGTGRLKEALRVREQIRTLEPLVPIYKIVTADILETAGDGQAAIAQLEAVAPTGGAITVRYLYLSRAYAGAGRYAESAEALLALDTPNFPTLMREAYARLLRNAATKTGPPQALPDVYGNFYIYYHVGATDRVLDGPERAIAVNYTHRVWMSYLWDPLSAPLRKTERYRAIIRSAGLPAYWRARGWPDFCRPIGADDFACE
jgi:TolB-like protein